MRARLLAVVVTGTARDAMAKDFPRLTPDQTVRQAVRTLLEAGWLSGVVVDRDGVPLGTFGRRDVLRALSERTGGFYSEQELAFALLRGDVFGSDALRRLWHDSSDAPVESMMGREFPTVTEDTPLETVARRFAGGETELAAVVRRGRAVGALRPHDVLAWVAANRKRGRALTRPA